MAIEHKDIPDAQRHEPKGISAATNKQVYLANGSGSGIWSRVFETDLDYTNKAKNVFGWADIADSQYTVGSPLAVAATTRTKLTNNALAPQTDSTRLPGIWNAANNRFLINDLNAAYVLRIQCRVRAVAAAGTPYVVKFEIQSANGPTVIAATDMFIKGGSYDNAIGYATLLYTGSFVNNQPIEVFVTPDTAITLYNIGFTVQRTYKET
jgi:hypothetical protein